MITSSFISSLSLISSAVNSPPLTTTSGLTLSLITFGLISSKITTSSTQSIACITAFLSFSELIGLSLPFNSFIESSEFIATINLSPNLLANCSRPICPVCNISKQPFVKTILLGFCSEIFSTLLTCLPSPNGVEIQESTICKDCFSVVIQEPRHITFESLCSLVSGAVSKYEPTSLLHS